MLHVSSLTRNNALKIITASLLLSLGACATESNKTLEIQHIPSSYSAYNGPRMSVSIGTFDNRSNYMRGIFAGATDTLGSSARTVLETNLAESNHFNVMDRNNLNQIAQENNFNGTKAHIECAHYIVTGDITAFGRKETGDIELFGILGGGKKQTAYAKVQLNIVDTNTSQIVYNAQGAGEYQLSNREILGFGGASSYDATLNGKVLDLAIRQAVTNLIQVIDSHPLAQ